jgi:hypothetical protein
MRADPEDERVRIVQPEDKLVEDALVRRRGERAGRPGIAEKKNALESLGAIGELERGVLEKENISGLVRAQDHEKIEEMRLIQRTRWIISMTDALIES